jgi:3-oxoacyl-[acyl-carrier protein] reductase
MRTGLEGRVVAITGAGSGIGLATARAMATEGARVVAVDLRMESVKALQAELGDQYLPIAADIATTTGAKAVVAGCLERFGRFDVLVTCAGVYETASVADMTESDWDRVLGVNLRGTFLCAQAALPLMAANGWGRIVTLSSVAAMTGGMAAGPAYVASKAGVMGLTRSLAHAGGPDGVTANCVHPGIIDTPMTAVLDDATRRAAADRTALRRTGTPEEVAAVIVMLASDAASFVTGAHLSVNGGLLMD